MPIRIVPHKDFANLLGDLIGDISGREPALRPDPVVIPSIPFSDHLQLAIAEKFGICMGMEFLTPSGFISRLTSRENASPWSRDQLAWRILPHASEYACQLGIDPAAASPRDLFAVSELLADRLDQYGHFRPEIIQAWNAGRRFLPENADEPWQMQLWTALKDEIGAGSPHPAISLQQLGGDAAFQERAKNDFPKLTVIGTGSIDPLLVEVLKLLSQAGSDITLHVLLPTMEYLGELKARKELLAEALKNPEVFSDDAGHPLISSMSRHAVGSFLLLGTLDEQFTNWPEAGSGGPPARGASLLNRLQSDIHRLAGPAKCENAADVNGTNLSPEGATSNSPGQASAPLWVLKNEKPCPEWAASQTALNLAPFAADASVRVHSCYGPRREMEVLRDEILRAFQEIDRLQPGDIHIVTPSLETYAPLIPAVLEQISHHGENPAGQIPLEKILKVRVTEISRAGQDPVTLGLLSLLEMATGGRHEASWIMELLHLASVQKAHGINDDERGLERVRGWIRDSGLTSGLGENSAAPETGSWGFARERLIAGLWQGNLESARYPEEGSFVLPVSDQLASDAKLLEGFLGWHLLLEETMKSWQLPAKPAEWGERLKCILPGLLGGGDGDDLNVRPHLLFLQGLACETLVDAGTILDWLDGVTGEERRRSPNSGKITFGRFKQLQNIPCKVLAMVGMQDGAFPGQSRLPAWDLLQASPKMWDRNPRVDDRQLFLDALLTPGDRLIITGSTRNLRTNKEEPFSSCIDELLRVLAAMGAGRKQLVVEHPLQPFSAAYFLVEGSSLPRTFSPTSAAVARGIAEAGDERKLRPFWKQEPAQPAPDAPVEIEISLRDLIEFWKDPAKAFVKAQGVSLWRDGEDDEELDRAPITLDALESWKIKDAIVQEIAFGDGNLELIKSRLAANRLLPRGHLAANAWDENKRSAEPLGKKIRELRGEPVPIACELSLENNPDGLPDVNVKVTGQVCLDAAGEHIVSYRSGKADNPHHFIGPWIEAIFASHAGKNLPTILLSETHTEPCEENTLAVIVPGGDFQQQCDLIFLIQKLVAAYLLGRRRPLCYAPATSNEISKKLDPEARNPAPDLATAIQQAKSAKWDPGFGDNENEGDKAAAQIAWRDLDPFEDHEEWKRWADTIATPLREWGNF